jgi:hypothetical protein
MPCALQFDANPRTAAKNIMRFIAAPVLKDSKTEAMQAPEWG